MNSAEWTEAMAIWEGTETIKWLQLRKNSIIGNESTLWGRTVIWTNKIFPIKQMNNNN